MCCAPTSLCLGCLTGYYVARLAFWRVQPDLRFIFQLVRTMPTKAGTAATGIPRFSLNLQGNELVEGSDRLMRPRPLRPRLRPRRYASHAGRHPLCSLKPFGTPFHAGGETITSDGRGPSLALIARGQIAATLAGWICPVGLLGRASSVILGARPFVLGEAFNRGALRSPSQSGRGVRPPPPRSPRTNNLAPILRQARGDCDPRQAMPSSARSNPSG